MSYPTMPPASAVFTFRPLMRTNFSALIAAILLLPPICGQALAQSRPVTPPADALSPAPSNLSIEWEVKNRSRLFRNEADFRRHSTATRSDGILAAEQRLARA